VLTAEQLAEWEAYDKIDPIGMWRIEYNVANLCANMINIANAIYTKKGHKPKISSPVDFMPDWAGDLARFKERKKQTVEEQKAILLGIAANSRNNKTFRSRKELKKGK
jgi:hypothetical protein